MSLVAEDVHVRFGGLSALRSVDIELHPGAVTSLIGPNGAGKTTLLNCISGFVELTSGWIRLDGQPLTHMPPEARVHRGLARTFQTPRVDPDASVWDNVFVGCHPRSRTALLPTLLRTKVERKEHARFARRTNELIERFGFGHVADRPASDLSTGQLRCLEIARCMAMGPQFLLLDEPAAGLDGDEREELAVWILELAGDGAGVLLVEHHFDFVRRVSDSVTVLAQGEHVLAAAPTVVERDPAVIDAYLGGTHDA